MKANTTLQLPLKVIRYNVSMKREKNINFYTRETMSIENGKLYNHNPDLEEE